MTDEFAERPRALSKITHIFGFDKSDRLSSRQSRFYAWCWTLIWAALFGVLAFTSIRFSGGRLIYTLDDPYIHLSVAKHILLGGYGVNAEEFSSPSSSILYPLLLTLPLALGLGTAGPLLINASATGLSVWLLIEFFWRQTVGASVGQMAWVQVVCPLLILSINAFALPMTGMEHSLHVLLVIVAMRGLVALAENRKAPKSLLVAIVCMPFVRFEGAALSAAAILAMASIGRWRDAMVTTSLIIIGFGAWALLMHRFGLPFLPSSVLSKSALASSAEGRNSASFLAALVKSLEKSIDNRFGTIFALAICALVTVVLDQARKARPTLSPDLLIALAMALPLGAHLVMGQYGWFYRYEVYAVAILIVGGVYLLRGLFRRIVEGREAAVSLGLIAALAVLAAPYAFATWQTPLASRNIYEQQYQMHRFAAEFFPHRVAVNDLGWVSYGNDAFVLDLWGLGSETVRRLRSEGHLDARAMANLATKADVDYAMIYTDWFAGVIPERWCLVAVLKGEKVTAASGEVAFYATKASVVASLRDALEKFAPTLPARVALRMETLPCT